MAKTRDGVRLATGGVALVLLLAACGERANTGPSSGDGGASGATTGSGSPAGAVYGGGGESSRGGYGYGGGGGGGAGGGQSTGGGGSSVATVGQASFTFDPAEITVQSGATITVDNTDAGTPHTFTISGSDIDVTNDGGASQDVKIDLPPGTYEFVCRFHQSRGMTGTITVE